MTEKKLEDKDYFADALKSMIVMTESRKIAGMSGFRREAFALGAFRTSSKSEVSRRYDFDDLKIRPDYHISDELTGTRPVDYYYEDVPSKRTVALKYTKRDAWFNPTQKSKSVAEHKLKGVDAIRHNQAKAKEAKLKQIPKMFQPKPPNLPRKTSDDLW